MKNKLFGAAVALALVTVGFMGVPSASAAETDVVSITSQLLKKSLNRALSTYKNTRQPDADITVADAAKIKSLKVCSYSGDWDSGFLGASIHGYDETSTEVIGSHGLSDVKVYSSSDCLDSLEELPLLPNLETVEVDFPEGELLNLTPLRNLTNLKSLTIGSTGNPLKSFPEDLDKLSGLKALGVVVGDASVDFSTLNNLNLDYFDVLAMSPSESDFSVVDTLAEKNDNFAFSYASSGQIPQNFANFKHLREAMFIFDGPIAADVPQVLNNMSGLEGLVLSTRNTGRDITGAEQIKTVLGKYTFGNQDTEINLPNLRRLVVVGLNIDMKVFKNCTNLERISVTNPGHNSGLYQHNALSKVKILGIGGPHHSPTIESAWPKMDVRFEYDDFARMDNLKFLNLNTGTELNGDLCGLGDLTVLQKKIPSLKNKFLGFQNNAIVDDWGFYPLPTIKFNTDNNVAVNYGDGSGDYIYAFDSRYNIKNPAPDLHGLTWIYGNQEETYGRIESFRAQYGDEGFVFFYNENDLLNDRKYDESVTVSMDHSEGYREYWRTHHGFSFNQDTLTADLPDGYKLPVKNTDLANCQIRHIAADDPVVNTKDLSKSSNAMVVSNGDGSIKVLPDGQATHKISVHLNNQYGDLVHDDATYLRSGGLTGPHVNTRTGFLTLKLKENEPANQGYVLGQNIWATDLVLDNSSRSAGDLGAYTATVTSTKEGSPVFEVTYQDNVFDTGVLPALNGNNSVNSAGLVTPFGYPDPVNPNPDSGTNPGADSDNTSGTNPTAGGGSAKADSASSTGGTAAPKAPSGTGLATTGFDGARLLLVSAMLIVLGGVTLYRRRV